MILVTGGAGFIGSVLAKMLNEQGHENLCIVDRLGEGQSWLNLRKVQYERYIHADELFLDENSGYLASVQAIFHMGACSSTTERDMDFLMKNNVEYSQKLAQLAESRGVPFIYASSAATYGDGEQGYVDDEDSIKKLLPLNRYGYSKQLFDSWILSQTVRPKYFYGLKFFNVFGPNEYHKEEMRSLVHKAYGQILETGKVKLFKSHRDGYEDGKQLRDFVYVKDICRAMIEIFENYRTTPSGVYNMGTGQCRSFYDLVAATFKAMDREVNVEFIPMPESIRDQYQYYTQAEMKKFLDVFPSFKFLSLEQAVEDYVQTHLMSADQFY